MMSTYSNLDPRKPSVTLLEYDRFENWSELNSPDREGQPVDRRAYEAQKWEAQKAMIRKASDLTGIPFEKAEVAFSATPLTFQRYTASPFGCVLSSELVPDQSFARRLSAVTPIRGLYLTGSFVSGPGITSCLSSGVRTSNELIREEKL
jgi:phytoene dehydrogenase-like protein